jgi:hypothetical protein
MESRIQLTMLKILKRLMPTVDVPLSLANTIYNLSIIVLIGGSALVFCSAIGMVWSSVVRERHAVAEKAASIEVIRAQANAAVERAKADAAEANTQLALANAAVAAQKAAADAKVGTDKPGPPGSYREITAEARDQFKTFVKSFAKGRVFMDCVTTNPESTYYAGEISDMLKDAGYIVEQKSTSTLSAADAPSGVQMKIKSLAEQPVYAGTLQRGLEYIGINTTGELDDAAEDSVLIYVGNKP